MDEKENSELQYDIEEDIDEYNNKSVSSKDSDVDDIDSDIDDIEEIEEGNEDINKEQINLLNDDENTKYNHINIEDTSDDDYDEEYYQKFNNGLNNNFLEYFHSEIKIPNYMEIEELSNVIRDKNNTIIDNNHKTIPILTKYEKTRILGQRAKQINNGSKPYINLSENIIDGYLIAELELKQKKIPFIIRRPLPNGKFEYWKIKDLEIYY